MMPMGVCRFPVPIHSFYFDTYSFRISLITGFNKVFFKNFIFGRNGNPQLSQVWILWIFVESFC